MGGEGEDQTCRADGAPLGELGGASPCLNQLDTSISFFPAKVFGPDLNARTRIRAVGEIGSSREKLTGEPGVPLERGTLSLEGDNRSGIEPCALARDE